MAERKQMQRFTKHNMQDAAEIAQEKEKRDVNLEVLESEDKAIQQPVYQIRPHLNEKYANLYNISKLICLC